MQNPINRASFDDDVEFARILASIFRRHPDKIANIPSILAKYKGAENRESLLQFLVQKYGAEPSKEEAQEGALVRLSYAAAAADLCCLRETASALTAMGVSVDESSVQIGVPALHIAASKGKIASVRALLAAGSSVNSRDRDSGSTALMAAMSHGHLSTVLVLLRHSAKPDLQNIEGSTALVQAAL